MKKLIMAFLAAVGVALIIPAAAFAAATSTIVSGIVTNNTNMPVIGATVSVVCNGNTKTDTTDASGAYAVSFTIAECPAGKTAQVVASKGTANGANSGLIRGGHADINVAVLNVKIISTPELGLITGVGAMFLSGGAFYAVRKRQLSSRAQ